jgi:hypothetical protein
MDTPFTFALKMVKPDIISWIVDNTQVDFYLEDAEKMLPIELCMPLNDMELFKKMFQKMRVSSISNLGKETLKPKAFSTMKTKPTNTLSYQKLFSLIQRSIVFKNRNAFLFLLDFCKEKDPR